MKSLHHFLITLIWDALNKTFQSRISAGATKKIPGWSEVRAKSPTTWKDVLENVWNGVANWKTRRQSNHTMFPVFVWTMTKFKRKNWGPKVNCQKFASIVLKCLYRTRIGRPDILWSINKLARCVTKWTPSMCGSTLSIVFLYKIQILQEILKIQNHHQRVFCIFGSGCARSKLIISQFQRIRDHVAGCWFAYGWFLCARRMGFGHRSVENGSVNFTRDFQLLLRRRF